MDVTKLIEAGPLGVVVLLVVVFIWYIDRRDKSNQAFIKERDSQWQEFFKTISSADKQVMEALVAKIDSFHGDWRSHDTWERTKLDAMEAAITEPRTRRAK